MQHFQQACSAMMDGALAGDLDLIDDEFLQLSVSAHGRWERGDLALEVRRERLGLAPQFRHLRGRLPDDCRVVNAPRPAGCPSVVVADLVEDASAEDHNLRQRVRAFKVANGVCRKDADRHPRLVNDL